MSLAVSVSGAFYGIGIWLAVLAALGVVALILGTALRFGDWVGGKVRKLGFKAYEARRFGHACMFLMLGMIACAVLGAFYWR